MWFNKHSSFVVLFFETTSTCKSGWPKRHDASLLSTFLLRTQAEPPCLQIQLLENESLQSEATRLLMVCSPLFIAQAPHWLAEVPTSSGKQLGCPWIGTLRARKSCGFSACPQLCHLSLKVIPPLTHCLKWFSQAAFCLETFWDSSGLFS